MIARGLLLLTLVACSNRNEPGQSCDYDNDCVVGYVCFRGTCQTTKTRDELLNVQSGVGSNAPVERPAAGGDRVKVRVTHGEGTIFAACLPTERLVGGGCNGGEQCEAEHTCNWMRSFPRNFSEDDTVGARWVCSGARGTMYAFAMCAATSETAPTPPVVPADAGR